MTFSIHWIWSVDLISWLECNIEFSVVDFSLITHTVMALLSMCSQSLAYINIDEHKVKSQD